MWEWIKNLFRRNKKEEVNHERRESKITTAEPVEDNEILVEKTPVNQKPVEEKKPVQQQITPASPQKKVVTQKNVGKPVKRTPEPIVTEMNVTTTIERTTTETVYVTKHHYEQTSKSEILEKLHALYPNETKVSINETVQTAFDTIAEVLDRNEEVAIHNFGKLEPQRKESREGVNPLTGEEITIAATNSVKFKPAKHLKEEMSKQKWTGLYQVEKTIEKTVIDEYDFEKEVSTKTEATEFLNKIEEKYKEDLNLDEVVDGNESFEIEDPNPRKPKPASKPKPTVAERAKIDGSHMIDEERYELQKHANALRSHARNNNFSKSLIDVNLRDMTKKELIVYMKKIQKAQEK